VFILLLVNSFTYLLTYSSIPAEYFSNGQFTPLIKNITHLLSLQTQKAVEYDNMD